MEFDFTPEQIQLRKSVREFAEQEIRPHVLQWDEEEIFPLEVVKHAGRLGFLGAIFPEELGGAGLGYIEYSIIVEELSRIDPSVGLIVAAHNSLCTNHIYVAGSDEQRRKYIPKLASGEWIGSWSLTESESGSDAGGMRTKAVKDGPCWVINGSKVFTTNAGYADICVAMAVTDRASSHHGVSAFILETGVPGFHFGKKENKLGMRASSTGEVIFTDCRVPESQLLGKQGEDSSTACAFWMVDASPSPRSRWAPRRALTRPRSNIRNSANNSDGPSRSFNPSRISSPTWPPRLTPRACSPIAPDG